MNTNLLDSEEFPLNKFSGRLRKMFCVKNNPYYIFTSKRSFESSMKLINDYKSGNLEKDSCSKEDLLRAKHIVDSCYNSSTGKKILLPFRFCAFVPVNVFILLGVLNSRSILPTIFWQGINQTYNVALNFSYRGTSEKITKFQVLRNYGLAMLTSCGTAVSLNEWVKSTTRFKPRVKLVMLSWIPLLAVCAAQVMNVSMTRLGEITEGTTVYDENGNSLGVSKIAGRRSVALTVITRVLNACGVIGFSKAAKYGLVNFIPVFARNPSLHVHAQLLAITMALSIVLPCSISIFEQKRSIASEKLEKEFWNEKGLIYYDKGL